MDAMRIIETALLYVDHPAFAFDHICDALNAQLKSGDSGIDIGFTADTCARISANKTVFSGAGLQVEISPCPRPLPADGFMHALDSPLSAPFQGQLGDMLFRHKAHVMVTIRPQTGDGFSRDNRLIALRVAHMAATLVARWHQPAALHWRQSNQLITGAQYRGLADDPTPWALFARAQVFSATLAPEGKRCTGIRLDGVKSLIGRPILFGASELPFEQSYALALAFLRHAVQTGTPIPHGHSFGPEGSHTVSVAHIPASDENPDGYYELTAIDIIKDRTTMPPISAARHPEPDMTVSLPEPVNLAEEIARDHHKERTRSLAISYMMLVILPPIGLLLLLSNLFFGANAARTGLIASTSVAVVLLIGAFTFLNITGEDVANLENGTPITTLTLTD